MSALPLSQNNLTNASFAVESPWRKDFPSLQHQANGKPAVFLDTAASALKCRPVIEAISQGLSGPYANIHRGLYSWSQEITTSYEAVRTQAAHFVGASEQEIIFTRSTTESINLVAQSWGVQNLGKGDVVLLSGMEHHANIVPWQLLQERLGFEIQVIPVLPEGILDLNAYEKLLSPQVKMIGLVHISNALGTINPVEQMIEIAREKAPLTKVLIDASQSVMHKAIHVRKIDADFLTITGHKLYGPTGIGYLWVKKEILASMAPWQGGGDMIETVSFAKTTYKEGPARFEAGTPAILEVLGLGAALNYLENVGFEAICAHEKTLRNLLISELKGVEGVKIFGHAQGNEAPIVSFAFDSIHHADAAYIYDQEGIMLRTGHHCCMPLMATLGVEGTLRASIGMYTNGTDIAHFIQATRKVVEMLS